MILPQAVRIAVPPTVVTLLYFVLCWPLSSWSRRLERRLERGQIRAILQL